MLAITTDRSHQLPTKSPSQFGAIPIPFEGLLGPWGVGLADFAQPKKTTEILNSLVDELEKDRNLNIEQIHFFPLGGIKTNATWISNNGGKLEPPKI